MPPRIIVSEATKAKLREASGIVNKYAELDEQAAGTRFQWSSVDPALLAACVSAVTGAGDGISFSITSDGGAGVITVLSNAGPFKRYPSSSQAAEEHLRRLIAVNTPSK